MPHLVNQTKLLFWKKMYTNSFAGVQRSAHVSLINLLVCVAQIGSDRSRSCLTTNVVFGSYTDIPRTNWRSVVNRE